MRLCCLVVIIYGGQCFFHSTVKTGLLQKDSEIQMETENKRKPDRAVDAVNYYALISAYKVIRAYKKSDPESMGERLKKRFEVWMDEETHYREKHIAEMVVLEEMLYSFCFGAEINKEVGFELIPADEHL